MGALRINLTNGTSAFIDLSNASSVITKNHGFEVFQIEFTDSATATTQTWVVNRWQTPDMVIGKNIIWEKMMEVAYNIIAANPIEFGYPDLGNSPVTYVAYDDNKFLSSAIDLALSSVGEPAVLENRTAIYGLLQDADSAGEVVSEYFASVSSLEAAVKALKSDCEAVVAGGGSFTWPDGYVCTSAECCIQHAVDYEAAGKAALLEPFIQGIKWRHQYLFEGIFLEEK